MRLLLSDQWRYLGSRRGHAVRSAAIIVRKNVRKFVLWSTESSNSSTFLYPEFVQLVEEASHLQMCSTDFKGVAQKVGRQKENEHAFVWYGECCWLVYGACRWEVWDLVTTRLISGLDGTFRMQGVREKDYYEINYGFSNELQEKVGSW